MEFPFSTVLKLNTLFVKYTLYSLQLPRRRLQIISKVSRLEHQEIRALSTPVISHCPEAYGYDNDSLPSFLIRIRMRAGLLNLGSMRCLQLLCSISKCEHNITRLAYHFHFGISCRESFHTTIQHFPYIQFQKPTVVKTVDASQTHIKNLLKIFLVIYLLFVNNGAGEIFGTLPFA